MWSAFLPAPGWSRSRADAALPRLSGYVPEPVAAALGCWLSLQASHSCSRGSRDGRPVASSCYRCGGSSRSPVPGASSGVKPSRPAYPAAEVIGSRISDVAFTDPVRSRWGRADVLGSVAAEVASKAWARSGPVARSLGSRPIVPAWWLEPALTRFLGRDRCWGSTD